MPRPLLLALFTLGRDHEVSEYSSRILQAPVLWDTEPSRNASARLSGSQGHNHDPHEEDR